MHPYLLCNYPARAMLALLATFFNYCNRLLVGFPESERCSHTVSKCNGQPLSQHKALPSSYLLTLLIFETASWSLSWRLAARVWGRRFGLKLMPSEGISALSGEFSSAGNRKCGSLLQVLLPICCVTKHPHAPISPSVWHGSYYMSSSVNSLRSGIGCRQAASKYYCVRWGEHRKTPLTANVPQFSMGGEWVHTPVFTHPVCPAWLTQPFLFTAGRGAPHHVC